MKNKLNDFTENLLRLAALERASQFERRKNPHNILKKQEECLNTIDDVVLYANSAPHGQVEIVITDKNFDENQPIQRILENSLTRISSFNIPDPESKKVLMRTVIIIDPLWSDNLDVYHCQYGFDDSHLTKKI